LLGRARVWKFSIVHGILKKFFFSCFKRFFFHVRYRPVACLSWITLWHCLALYGVQLTSGSLSLGLAY
jgi:hypothetical protein